MNMLFKGLVIGLSIAAPVGPIGVLCIRRTLANGRVYGLVSGLGAATADAVYGTIAGLGLTVVSGVLVEQQTLLRLIGGLFLCYLGLKIFRARPAEESAEARAASLPAAYASTLLLTLTNPVTILAFAAIFAGLEMPSGDHTAALVLVLGVFLGSALWWLVLSGGVSLLRVTLTPRRLRWINWLSSLVLGGFGVAALVSLA